MKRYALALLFAVLAVSAVCGEEPLFEVIPPEKVPFLYPDPPREGAADFFPVAREGEALCVIVHPAAASAAALAAGREFQRYLELVTGAKFRLLADDRPLPTDLAAIHLGDTVLGRSVDLALPELRYGEDVFPNARGFLVKTLDRKTLLIRGPEEKATEHGIVGFLKRYCGVRQFWPGRPGGLGDVVPKRPDLALPEIEWRDWPYFFSVTFSQRQFGGSRPALDFYRRHQTLPAGENYNRWLPPAKFAESHPEYYPLVNGERRVPKEEDGSHGWQPCISNPEVPRVMAEAVIEFFRENPGAPGINFSINDGGGDCACEGCHALDAPGTDYATREGIEDRYLYLANRVCEIVAREFPNKRIVHLAYAAARHPSAKHPPHANLLPVLTWPDNFFAQWDRWMRAGPRHMGIYLHHNDTFAILPKHDPHRIARVIRYAVASGKARVFYMEMHTQWPFNDIIPHVTAELLWDPRQDVEKLIAEAFATFYGPAAPAMGRYSRILREGYDRWLEAEGLPHLHGKDVGSGRNGRSIEQFRVLSPEEAARAGAALDEAASLAAGDETVSQRLALVRAQFDLQEMALRQAWSVFRLRDAAPRSLAEAEALVQDARLVYELSPQMQRHIEEVLDKPPLKDWALYRLTTRPVTIFEEMESGIPGPEARAALGSGIAAAADFLRAELGPEPAAAWWRERQNAETDSELAAAFASAVERSLGSVPVNLLSDPGFEIAGRERAPDEFALSEEIELDLDEAQGLGMRQWFTDRSAYRCALSPKEPRSGRYSLMLESAYRARFSVGVKTEPGTRHRVGLWFRRNDGKASYQFAVDARLADGSFTTLARVPVSETPDVWREIATEVVTPPGASYLTLRLYIDRQATGARCWIDDAMIAK